MSKQLISQYCINNGSFSECARIFKEDSDFILTLEHDYTETLSIRLSKEMLLSIKSAAEGLTDRDISE